MHLQDSLYNYGKSDHALIPQCDLLREADLQVGKKKLRWGDGVIEDNKVRTEAVAAAELCQHQMHFVHTRQREREREEKLRNSMILAQSDLDPSMPSHTLIAPIF